MMRVLCLVGALVLGMGCDSHDDEHGEETPMEEWSGTDRNVLGLRGGQKYWFHPSRHPVQQMKTATRTAQLRR